MRKLIYILFFCLALGILLIPDTNSFFNETSSVSGNIFETKVEVTFYAREDGHAVGFNVKGIQKYDQLDYVIEYQHDPGIDEQIVGSIDNSSKQYEVTREWFFLGSCSSEGLVCVFHEGVSVVNLTLELLEGGMVTKTIHQSLSL